MPSQPRGLAVGKDGLVVVSCVNEVNHYLRLFLSKPNCNFIEQKSARYNLHLLNQVNN